MVFWSFFKFRGYFGNFKWFLSIFSEFGGILLILEVLRIFWYF